MTDPLPSLFQSSAVMLRFVILRHTPGSRSSAIRGTHFDWMFEVGESLRTFSTAPLRAFDSAIEIEAVPLDDHRLMYLDYEGEVSGDRGWVRREIAGEWQRQRDDEQAFEARLRWRDGEVTRRAIALFYRSFSEDSRRSDNCPGWWLRFEPC